MDFVTTYALIIYDDQILKYFAVSKIFVDSNQLQQESIQFKQLFIQFK